MLACLLIWYKAWSEPQAERHMVIPPFILDLRNLDAGSTPQSPWATGHPWKSSVLLPPSSVEGASKVAQDELSCPVASLGLIYLCTYKKIYFIIYLCVCAYPCECKCQQRPEEDVQFPGTGAIDGCDPLCGDWELN